MLLWILEYRTWETVEEIFVRENDVVNDIKS